MDDTIGELPLGLGQNLDEIGAAALSSIREELSVMTGLPSAKTALEASAKCVARWHTLQGFQMGLYKDADYTAKIEFTSDSATQLNDAGEPSVFSPAARREKEREMRLMHWLQHLPSPSLLSQRKRLVKLRCERLAVRLVAETGSEATQDVHFKDVGIMGSYGAVVADMVSKNMLECELNEIDAHDRLAIVRGAVVELSDIRGILETVVPTKEDPKKTFRVVSKGRRRSLGSRGHATSKLKTDSKASLPHAHMGRRSSSADPAVARQATLTPDVLAQHDANAHHHKLPIETQKLLHHITELQKKMMRRYRLLLDEAITADAANGRNDKAAAVDKVTVQTDEGIRGFVSQPLVMDAGHAKFRGGRPVVVPPRPVTAMPWDSLQEYTAVVPNSRLRAPPHPTVPASHNSHGVPTLKPAVWPVPIRPPDSMHLCSGMDSLWRWRCNRTRQKLLFALGARRVLVCLAAGVDWGVAGLRERFKATQRACGRDMLESSLGTMQTRSVLIRTSWHRACEKTVASLTGVAADGLDRSSSHRRRESDNVALMVLASRAEEVIAELAKCSDAVETTMKAIEGQFIEAAGAVRWKATYGTQESIGPSHKSLEFADVSKKETLARLSTPDRRDHLLQYQQDLLAELLCIRRAAVDIIQSGLVACVSTLQREAASVSKEQHNKTELDLRLRELQVNHDSASHEWSVAQGRLTGTTGTPHTPKIGVTRALTIKRRELKLRALLGHYLAIHSEHYQESVRQAKVRLAESNMAVFMASDDSFFEFLAARVTSGVEVPGEASTSFGDTFPGLPQALGSPRALTRPGPPLGPRSALATMGRLRSSKGRTGFHKAQPPTPLPLPSKPIKNADLLKTLKADYKAAKQQLAEDAIAFSSQTRAKAAACRAEGSLTFWQKAGCFTKAKPAPQPTFHDFWLIIAVYEARDLLNIQQLGTQDPYVEIRCGKYGIRTETQEDAGVEATWNFKAQCDAHKDDDITFTVWNENIGKDEVIGTTTFGPLGELLGDGHSREMWLPLVDSMGTGSAGELRVKLGLVLPGGEPFKITTQADIEALHTNYLVADVDSRVLGSQAVFNAAIDGVVLRRNVHSAKWVYAHASAELYLTKRLIARATRDEIMELCVAKAQTAEAEVKVLVGNNELKRAREAGWAAEGQSNAIKGLLWDVAESCVASAQVARRRQWKITADILETTRQRSLAKFHDMQITVLKVANKFVDRLLRLNGSQVTQDKLFVEISAPALKSAKSGVNFGAHLRDSPAVPLLSVPPILEKRLQKPSEKYKASSPAPSPLSVQSHPADMRRTGTGDPRASPSIADDSDPPAAPIRIGFSTPADTSSKNRGKNMFSKFLRFTSSKVAPHETEVSHSASMYMPRSKLGPSHQATVLSSGEGSLSSPIVGLDPEGIASLRSPAFAWPLGLEWTVIQTVDSLVQDLLWSVYDELTPESGVSKEHSLQKLLARLDKGLEAATKSGVEYNGLEDPIEDWLRLPTARLTLPRHKAKKRFLIVLGYFVGLRRLHLVMQKRSTESLATLSSVTAFSNQTRQATTQGTPLSPDVVSGHFPVDSTLSPKPSPLATAPVSSSQGTRRVLFEL